MNFKIRDLWGALGVALGLIALYLVLSRGTSAARVIGQVGETTATLFKVLQGR